MEQRYSPELIVTLNDFELSGWDQVATSVEPKEYSSYWLAFSQAAQEASKLQQIKTSKVLWLLAEACSMRLIPESRNEPFQPMVQLDDGRSAILSDFTQADLNFFDEILPSIADPLLGARLADILWLLSTPKNMQHVHQAIELYTSLEITEHNSLGTLKLWECGARLAKTFKKATKDKLDRIEAALLEAFRQDYTDHAMLVCDLGQLLVDLGFAYEQLEETAGRLYKCGQAIGERTSLHASRSYFELAQMCFRKVGDNTAANDCLLAIADSFVSEAEHRLSGENPSQMVANSFYENAIQAYRRIVVKDRESYGVSEKIAEIRHRLADTGKGSLGEMGLIQTPSIDISDLATSAKEHVSGKKTPQDALLYFTGLYAGPKYDNLKQSAEEQLRDSPLRAMFGTTHMAADGRVVARTPGIDITNPDSPENETVLWKETLWNFSIEQNLTVRGKILPALDVLHKEHTITRKLLLSLCLQSPFVPYGREELTAKALWFGFEGDFGTAIHLLTPQLEHMIRTCLKASGTHTSHLGPNGIETENGLSSLLDLSEAEVLFGQDYLFEFKAVLADVYGANLRNEVAHGLLNDNSSSSITTIYAWWFTLRWVIRSIVCAETKMACPTEESSKG